MTFMSFEIEGALNSLYTDTNRATQAKKATVVSKSMISSLGSTKMEPFFDQNSAVLKNCSTFEDYLSHDKLTCCYP